MYSKDQVSALRHFAMRLDVKDHDVKAGVISGYLSTFNDVDRQRENVLPGAFLESLEQRKGRGGTFPMLWNHNQDQPIGYFPKMEEDTVGLRFEGATLLVDDIPMARSVNAMVKAGAIDELSMGYTRKEWYVDSTTGVLVHKRVNLVEGSLVLFPSNPNARLDALKKAMREGADLTAREVESMLREVLELPQRYAKRFASAYCATIDRDGPGDSSETVSAVQKALDPFSTFTL